MTAVEPMFPPGAAIRRVNEEPAIMFGAGRALLLQLAHPHVAAGVDEHSDFRSNPFGRLLGTLEAVYTMVFGSTAEAAGVGRRVRWVHDFVSGPAYRANDPANLLWVHATLADSALTSYQRLVGPLPPEEQEAYYQEMTQVAEAFGCPRREQPADLAAFRDYFDEQVQTLEVTEVARRLARDVLEPRLPQGLHVPLRPVIAVSRLVTVGTLPPPIRDRFGYRWTDGDQHRLDRLLDAAGAGTRATPRALRVGPVHLHGRLVLLPRARRHIAELDARRRGRGGEVAAA